MSNVMRSEMKRGWEGGGLVVARATSSSLQGHSAGVTLTASVSLHYSVLHLPVSC